MSKEVFGKLAEEAAETQKLKNDVAPMFITTEEGVIKKLITNVRIMIGLDPLFKQIKFNEFTQEATIQGKPIDDGLLEDMRGVFDARYHIKFSKDDVYAAVRMYSKEHSYHPIKNMIESKKWDGTSRVETIFIDYLGAEDNVYTRSVARKWLTGAVARVYKPAIKFEMVPMLSGKQGVGKSTLANKLGGDYFVDSLMGLGRNKDDYQQLIGAWVIELAELSSLNKTDIETMKGFISATTDKIRLPYSKIPTTHERTSVFIGTTNASEYLGDLTGNRRFFPIQLGEAKAAKSVFELSQETVQQIWAEAYVLFASGEELFMSDEEELTLAHVARSGALEKDLAVNEIDDYLDMPVTTEWNSYSLYDKKAQFKKFQSTGKTDGTTLMDRTSANEILKVISDADVSQYQSTSLSKRIRLYMDNLENWKRKQVWMYGKTVRGYVRIK